MKITRRQLRKLISEISNRSHKYPRQSELMQHVVTHIEDILNSHPGIEKWQLRRNKDILIHRAPFYKHDWLIIAPRYWYHDATPGQYGDPMIVVVPSQSKAVQIYLDDPELFDKIREELLKYLGPSTNEAW